MLTWSSRTPTPTTPRLSSAALDPCASSPCLNGGSCTNTQDPASYHCTCPVAFTGKDCSLGEWGVGAGARARGCPWEEVNGRLPAACRGRGPAWGQWCAESKGLTARPAEKCFDETRYEYMEVGDRWARVHQGRVEQCECAQGHVQCEDTRHTGTLWPGRQVKSLPNGCPHAPSPPRGGASPG